MSESTPSPRAPGLFVSLTHEWILRFPKLMGEAEQRVYMALAKHFAPGHHGLVWPKLRTLAEMTGYAAHGRPVAAATRKLERLGLIDIIDWEVRLPGRRPGPRRSRAQHKRTAAHSRLSPGPAVSAHFSHVSSTLQNGPVAAQK